MPPKGWQMAVVDGRQAAVHQGQYAASQIQFTPHHHPEGQHEFKITPVTGAQVMGQLGKHSIPVAAHL